MNTGAASETASPRFIDDTLLLVMNPRRIPECMGPLEAMPCDVLYVRGMRLDGAVRAISATIEKGDYARYVIVADDCIVTERALRLVVETSRKLPGAVVTGYCNLDENSPLVNITRGPVRGDTPTVEGYDFYSRAEVEAATGTVPSGFAGMALTCLPAEVAPRVTPLGFFQAGGTAYSSDFHLSKRLEREGIPVVAPVGAFVYHVKERWNQQDRAADKQLHIGSPELVLQRPGEETIHMAVIHSGSLKEARGMSDKVAEKDIIEVQPDGRRVVRVPKGQPIPADLDLSKTDYKAQQAPPENKARTSTRAKGK